MLHPTMSGSTDGAPEPVPTDERRGRLIAFDVVHAPSCTATAVERRRVLVRDGVCCGCEAFVVEADVSYEPRHGVGRGDAEALASAASYAGLIHANGRRQIAAARAAAEGR